MIWWFSRYQNSLSNELECNPINLGDVTSLPLVCICWFPFSCYDYGDNQMFHSWRVQGWLFVTYIVCFVHTRVAVYPLVCNCELLCEPRVLSNFQGWLLHSEMVYVMWFWWIIDPRPHHLMLPSLVGIISTYVSSYTAKQLELKVERRWRGEIDNTNSWTTTKWSMSTMLGCDGVWLRPLLLSPTRRSPMRSCWQWTVTLKYAKSNASITVCCKVLPLSCDAREPICLRLEPVRDVCYGRFAARL